METQNDPAEAQPALTARVATELTVTASVPRLPPMDVVGMAQGLVIADQAACEAVCGESGLLAALKRRLKVIADHYAAVRRPFNDALKQVRAMEATDTEPVQAAHDLVEGKVLAFRREAREAAERAEREAALQAEAEHREVVAAFEEAAQALPEIAPTLEAIRAAGPQPATTAVSRPSNQAGGVTFRTTWRAEVTDLQRLVLGVAVGILAERWIDGRRVPQAVLAFFDRKGIRAVPIEAIEPAMPWLNDQARQFTTTWDLPGVRAVSEEGTARKAGRR